MADGVRLFLTFVAAAALTVVTVPAAIAIAGRTGFLDRPAGYKAHAAPTPYLGGLAVLVAWLAAALAFGGGDGYGSLLVGTVGLAAVGTIDDRHNLSPLLRVALEVAAAWLLWDAGIHWSVFGVGALDFALSAFWLVSIVNALNLMDNLDGAAASVGGVCALGLGVLAQIGGDLALAVLAFGLGGALLGFLRHNLARPSRIFLGDGGSMAVGFFLAAGLMAAQMGGLDGVASLVVAAVAVGLPVFDTTLVVLSRRRRGAPILSGATDHTTHRLRAVLKTPRAVAAVLALVQALLCALAIEASRLGDGAAIGLAFICLVSMAATIAVIDGTRWTPASGKS